MLTPSILKRIVLQHLHDQADTPIFLFNCFHTCLGDTAKLQRWAFRSSLWSGVGLLDTHLQKSSGYVSAQSCLTPHDPMDCSPSGSSVHGILQATMLEWVANSSSRRSPWPRDQIQVSCLAGRFFTTEPLGKPINTFKGYQLHVGQIQNSEPDSHSLPLKHWTQHFLTVRQVYAPRFFVLSQQRFGVTDIKAPLAGHSSRVLDRPC